MSKEKMSAIGKVLDITRSESTMTNFNDGLSFEGLSSGCKQTRNELMKT